MKRFFDARRVGCASERRSVWRGAVRSLLLPFALTVSVLACASAFAASPPEPTPGGRSIPEHHLGKIVSAELLTPDLAATKRFYGGLFGWRFNDSGGETQATVDGRQVARLAQRALGEVVARQPAWLRFVAVSDIDSAQRAALDNGARPLSTRRNLHGGARAAVFADPQGAVFGMLAAPDGEPPDVLAEPGEWIWCSLLTADADADAAFYQKVFDYDVFEMPADGDRRHLLLASEDYARASLNTAPASAPAVHPHWLHYVRVDDAAASAARAVALGGRVLVEPRPDRQGGKVAVVADPQGAPIGLLEWPDDDERAAAR